MTLEKNKLDYEAAGEIKPPTSVILGHKIRFFVGNLKGVERIYQQPFIDTYSKMPITSVDVPNDKVLSLSTSAAKATYFDRQRHGILWLGLAV